ncbi:MAG: hypothetical protein MI922_14680 [Bacteroidales bacterium]|nr:hypothetical protein [Bacteroidales bacterium]
MFQSVDTDLKCKKPKPKPKPVTDCGVEIVKYPLIIKKGCKIGYVTITNNEKDVVVKFYTSRYLPMKSLAFWIGDETKIPLNKKGVPAKGKFKFKKKFKKRTHFYQITVPISKLPECPVFFATVEAKSCRNTYSAWAGTISFKEFFKTRKWGYFDRYCVKLCPTDEDKLFTIKFHVKNDKGESFWAAINTGEFHYQTGDWCDKMSVVTLKDSTYPVVLYNNDYEFDFGKVTTKVVDDKVTVINAITTFGYEDFVIYKTFGFIGTEDELKALEGDNGCPANESFPLYEEVEGRELEFEYNMN